MIDISKEPNIKLAKKCIQYTYEYLKENPTTGRLSEELDSIHGRVPILSELSLLGSDEESMELYRNQALMIIRLLDYHKTKGLTK